MMEDASADRPRLRLKPKAERRALLGHPWIFSNELEMEGEAKTLDPGALVVVETAHGQPLGCYVYNRHPLIAARRLSADPLAVVDVDFFARLLRRALDLRDRLIGVPFYRLIHAEADGLPGCIIDRYGDAVVLQLNSAGLDRQRDSLLAALDEVCAPRTIVLRNDSSARELEGLERTVEVVRGDVGTPVEIVEHGARFLADLGTGQKTGWFYDQRDNRLWAADLIRRAPRPARVLDLYAFCGGFAVQAALAGAGEVVAVDRSRPALDVAAAAAALNGVAERCRFERSDVFDALQQLVAGGEHFDLVIADPPAFAKSRKDVPQALRAYRKLARLAAGRVAEGGFLVCCSCSHHVTPDAFHEQVARGLNDAGRGARLLRAAGAAPDHPTHPQLPESAYLKALFFALD